MPLIVNSPIVHFADDAKMFKTIVTIDLFSKILIYFMNGPKNGSRSLI